MLKMPLPNIAANSEALRALKPAQQYKTNLVGAKRLIASVVIEAKDVFSEDIGATSMRTVYVARGVLIGSEYEFEDAEGYFPDAAVKFLAEGRGRFGHTKNNQGKDDG